MGATESSQSESSSSTIVDRMSSCPVCYEKYTSHIYQCKSGHAVCRECKVKLTRCPQCSSAYVGTRNYVLEEIISELDRLNCSPEQAVNAVKEAMMTADLCRTMNNMIDQIDRINQGLTESIASSSGTRQSPAQTENTVCRMQYCRQTMNPKALERHLLDRHSQNVRRLAALSYLSKSHFSFNLTCTNSRFALLTEFGIFFLIIRVNPSRTISDRLIVTAWVQGACTSVEASLFYSWMQIEVRNTKAVYHDIVHHSRSNVAQIEDADQCLLFSVKAENYDQLLIKGYVCLNRCKQERPRRTLATEFEIYRSDSSSED